MPTIVDGTAGVTFPAGGVGNPASAVVGLTDTQTLTNKTLTSPVISSISNSGTITIPTGTDTLVGKATTDTLTNKTLTSPTLTTPNINSAQIPTVSGTAPLYFARAWVNFNGTTNVGGFCTISGSANVSSVTDNGTGDYTVTFTTAMSDINYAVSGMAKSSDTAGTRMAAMQLIANATAIATSFVRVTVQYDNTNTRDANPVSVVIIR